MPNIYTTRCTADVIPKALAPLLVPATQMTLFALPFANRGAIQRLVVTQASGTAVDFSVDLFSSKTVLAPGNYAQSQTLNNPDYYRILPSPFTATVGNPVTFFSDDGYGFRNADTTYTQSHLGYVLYLLIKPSGNATDTTWNVLLQCINS